MSKKTNEKKALRHSYPRHYIDSGLSCATVKLTECIFFRLSMFVIKIAKLALQIHTHQFIRALYSLNEIKQNKIEMPRHEIARTYQAKLETERINISCVL